MVIEMRGWLHVHVDVAGAARVARAPFEGHRRLLEVLPERAH